MFAATAVDFCVTAGAGETEAGALVEGWVVCCLTAGGTGTVAGVCAGLIGAGIGAATEAGALEGALASAGLAAQA